jgi:hypothetical protein
VEQVGEALSLNAMPVQANLVLNWRYKKLAVLAATSFTGRTLRSVSQKTIQYKNLPTEYYNVRERNEARTVVDLKLEYRWKRSVTPYLQIRNLFNDPGHLTDDGHYVYDLERGWPTYEIGVRGQF